MAAEDKNTRLKSNMTVAILSGAGRFAARRPPGLRFSALEGPENQKANTTWIFTPSSSLALAVFIFLRLRSVLGQRTGSKRPFRVSAFTYRLSMIAAVLCAVNYVAYEAKWYSALEARVTPITTISSLARVVDGDTVVVLLAMALLLGAALVLSFLHWKDWKAGPTTLATARGARHTVASTNTSSNVCEGSSREGTKCQKPGLKKAKPLDGLLREDGAADAQSAREFRTVFNMTSQASKEAMIENWMRRKGCSRSEAMRLAVEEWRRDNR